MFAKFRYPIASLIALSLCASAQGAPPNASPCCTNSMGWGAGGAHWMAIDMSKRTKIDGTLVAVEELASPRFGRQGAGIHVKVRASSGSKVTDVLLGPAWYVKRQDLTLLKGDRVEIEGVPESAAPDARYLAIEIRKGSQVLRLRDDAGWPSWAGARGSGMGAM